MLNFFREIASLYKLIYKIDKKDRDIVFYAEDKASYGYFEGLIEHLTDKDKLTVHYVTSDINDPVFRSSNKRIVPHYINYLLFIFTLRLDSKLLVMTMPDLHQAHVKRSRCGAHHLYIFHSISSSFPINRYGAVFHYDTIFCSGPHHNEEILIQEKLYNLNKKKLVDFGYYKLEKVYNDYRKYLEKKPAKKSSKYKGSVLLGPSWGDNTILNLCGAELIKTLLDANYEVIVRPHPMTRKLTPKVLNDLSKEFSGYDNFVLKEDISMIDSLFEADVLISDWSGLTFEYAFGTERPVLFIDVPLKVVNERYKEVGIEPMDVTVRERIGAVLSTGELNRADELLTGLMENKERYTEDIRRVRDEVIYNFGSSSEHGAAYIKELLKKGGKR